MAKKSTAVKKPEPFMRTNEHNELLNALYPDGGYSPIDENISALLTNGYILKTDEVDGDGDILFQLTKLGLETIGKPALIEVDVLEFVSNVTTLPVPAPVVTLIPPIALKLPEGFGLEVVNMPISQTKAGRRGSAATEDKYGLETLLNVGDARFIKATTDIPDPCKFYAPAVSRYNAKYGEPVLNEKGEPMTKISTYKGEEVIKPVLNFTKHWIIFRASNGLDAFIQRDK